MTSVGVHPLGVDADAAAASARTSRTWPTGWTRWRAQAAGRRLIVRVDRTELSKNIVRGLEAYRELLRLIPSGAAR